MAISEELKIIIKSVFDSKGFKNAKSALGKISALGKRFGGLQAFGNVKALGEQSEELQRVNGFLKDYGIRASASTKYLTKMDKKTAASSYSLRQVSEAIASGDWGTYNRNLNKSNALAKDMTVQLKPVKSISDAVSNSMMGLSKSSKAWVSPLQKINKGVSAGATNMISFDDVIKKTANTIKPAISDMKGFGKQSAEAFEAKKYQVFLDQNKRLKEFGFQVKEGGNVVNKLGKQLSKTEKQALISPQSAADFETFNKQLYSSPALLRKTGLGLKAFRGQFKMHLLSVMFFGMQLQRVFMQMGRKTLETYMKMSEGATQAGQGLNMLQAAFTTLKYSVGEAIAESLLPFIPAILNIIMGISNFIEKNQGLVAGLIAFGAAAGTALFMIGQVGLGIQGVSTLLNPLKNLFSKLGPAITSAIGAIKPALNKGIAAFKNFFSNPWVSRLLGAGLLLIAGWKWIEAISGREGASLGNILLTSIMAGLGAGLLFNPVTGVITGLVIMATMIIDKVIKDKLSTEQLSIKKDFQETINDAMKGGFVLPVEFYEQEAKKAAGLMGTSYLKEFESIKFDWDVGIVIDEVAYKTQLANVLQTAYRETDNITKTMESVLVRIPFEIEPPKENLFQILGFQDVVTKFGSTHQLIIKEVDEMVGEIQEYSLDWENFMQSEKAKTEILKTKQLFSDLTNSIISESGEEGKVSTIGVFNSFNKTLEETSEMLGTTLVTEITKSESALEKNATAAHKNAFYHAALNDTIINGRTTVPIFNG